MRPPAPKLTHKGVSEMSKQVYESPLSSRYASDEMQYIFSPDKKFTTWRRLWIALARAEMELGLPVTQDQIDEMEAHLHEIDYDLAVSTDARQWTTLRENVSFDNIVNNPIRRTVGFGRTVRARYVRLVPRRTQSGEGYGVGEFGVLTDRSRIPYVSAEE